MLGSLYADFLINDNTALYIGGGIGISQFKEKVTTYGDSIVLINNIEDDKEHFSNKYTTKPKTNFAYSLTIGASTKITDNVHIELAYSWKDYGKTHPRLDEDGERTHDKAHYRGHHVGLGIRFDI